MNMTDNKYKCDCDNIDYLYKPILMRLSGKWWKSYSILKM